MNIKNTFLTTLVVMFSLVVVAQEEEARTDPIPGMRIFPQARQDVRSNATPLLSASPSMESLETQLEPGHDEDWRDEGHANEGTNDERQSDASFSMHSDPCLAAARHGLCWIYIFMCEYCSTICNL